MRAIKKDQIKILERRRDFLQKRVNKRGEMRGGDYDLAETWYGRAFIHIYYAISPTLV